MRVFSSASRAILHALRVRDAPPAVGRPAPAGEPPLPGLIPSRPRAKRPRPGVIAPLSRVSGSGAERLSPPAPLAGPDAPSPCRPAPFRPRAPQFPARSAPLPRREAHIRRSPAPLPRPAQNSRDGPDKRRRAHPPRRRSESGRRTIGVCQRLADRLRPPNPRQTARTANPTHWRSGTTPHGIHNHTPDFQDSRYLAHRPPPVGMRSRSRAHTNRLATISALMQNRSSRRFGPSSPSYSRKGKRSSVQMP